MSATITSILALEPAPPQAGGPAGAPAAPLSAQKEGARGTEHEARESSESLQWHSLSDEELLRRYCSANDQLAFQTLYLRYRAHLYRFVLRLSPSRHEAEEVFQETWMAVVKAKQPNTVRFAAYLFAIAHRRLSDHWRRRQRLSALEDASTAAPCDPDELADDLTLPPEAWAHLEQLHEALLRELGKLPVLQREVFLMKAEANLSLEEIASIMGATHEATKSRLRYALGRLRAALEDWK